MSLVLFPYCKFRSAILYSLLATFSFGIFFSPNIKNISLPENEVECALENKISENELELNASFKYDKPKQVKKVLLFILSELDSEVLTDKFLVFYQSCPLYLF